MQAERVRNLLLTWTAAERAELARLLVKLNGSVDERLRALAGAAR